MNDLWITEGASALSIVQQAKNASQDKYVVLGDEVHSIFEKFIAADIEKKEKSIIVSLPIGFSFIHEYTDDFGELVIDELFLNFSFHHDIFIFELNGSMFFTVDFDHKGEDMTEITDKTIGIFVKNLHDEIVYEVPLNMNDKGIVFPGGYYEDFYDKNIHELSPTIKGALSPVPSKKRK